MYTDSAIVDGKEDVTDVLFCCYFREAVKRQKTAFPGREMGFSEVLVLNLCSPPTR